MSGALQLLRDAIIAGDHIVVDDTSIAINDAVRFDRSAGTKVRHLVGRSNKEYTLEEVYFQYIFRDLPYNRYLSECAKKGVQHVVAIDRNPLVDYLTGNTDSLANIAPDEPSVNELNALSRKSSKQESKKEKVEVPTAENDELSGFDKENKLTFAKNRLRVRDQRSIDSVLMVKDWDFSSLRDKLSQHVLSGRRSRGNNMPIGGSGGHVADHNNHRQQRPRPQLDTSAKPYDPRGDRYTSNEDRFWRENMGSDFQQFGIDMSGSFKAKPSSSQPNSQSRQQGRKSSNTRPNLKPTDQLSHGSNLTRSSADHSFKEGASPAKRRKMVKSTAIPIIIIPAGTSSLVCAANAVEFFQNGHLMTTDEMRNKKISLSQPARLSLWRRPGGDCSQAQYHIVSNPSRLSREEWEHVVAVVLSGHSWQFKNWPIYKGDVQEFFKTVQGFYFLYDDVKPSGDVNQWTVRKLTFPRDRRHNDGQVQAQFWNFVDSFISRNRIPVRY